MTLFAFEVLLLVSTGLGALAAGAFAVECVAAWLGAHGPRWLRTGRCRLPSSAARPRVTVLVPAHDEAQGVAATVAALRAELVAEDRLLVVADNCTDETAARARAAGAEVIERRAPDARGKGFALSFGREHLTQAPPDVVIMIDADCRVSPGSIERLARHAAAVDHPVQAEYLLEPRHRVPGGAASALAFLVRNRVRPRGLAALGLPTQLTGSGMAFRWDVLEDLPLGGGAIVEDMQIGVEAALRGRPAMLCAEAQVTSELPGSRTAVLAQRRRWEHGHLATILGEVPRLIGAAVRRRRPGLLALAADLAIPPLSLLVLTLAFAYVVGGLLAVTGASGISALPVISLLAAAGLAALALGLVAAWHGFARQQVPARALLDLPKYVIGKLPLYAAFVFRRERRWVRTERGPAPVESSPPGPSAGSDLGSQVVPAGSGGSGATAGTTSPARSHVL